MRNNRFVYGEGQYSYAKRPQPELWNEYREYIVKNKLDKNERKLLRDWIKDGHSVYEIVESRYLPGPAYPPMDLIDAYRLDCSISDDIEGMTKEEKESVTQLFPVPSDCNITANYFLFLLPFRNSSVLFSEARFFLCFN